MNERVKIRREQLLRLLDGFRVQVQTAVGLLEVESDVDTEWQPLRRILTPRHILEHHRANGMDLPVSMWVNDTYEVMVYEHGGDPPMTQLSIKRYDRAAIRNWRHFQQMKNEIAGRFREAVEIFPSEARIADNANQYHLWVAPEGLQIPFGFEAGMVLIEPGDVEAYNTMGAGRQEPMQPGLTIGRQMQKAQTAAGIRPQELLKGLGRK